MIKINHKEWKFRCILRNFSISLQQINTLAHLTIDLYQKTIVLTHWSRENCRHFADDIFKDISLTENLRSLTSLTEMCSLGFDWQYGSISSDNDLEPLSEPMMLSIDGAYMRHSASMSCTNIGILIIWIRWSHSCLIFMMEISICGISGNTFYIETGFSPMTTSGERLHLINRFKTKWNIDIIFVLTKEGRMRKDKIRKWYSLTSVLTHSCHYIPGPPFTNMV